ncbi:MULTISPECIES: GTP-binding protein [Hyphobacterium]|uniref:GTP-binding protein n=1 Tax=Hyphobacterium vulgare TaxID=1736751 RepID=A0ABV6ZTB8_9PROT
MNRRSLLTALGGTALSLVVPGSALGRTGSAPVRMVFAGSSAVGKTTLLIAYTSNVFPGEYVPSVFDNYQANVRRADGIQEMQLRDTPGSSEYARLRPLSYAGSDVAGLCFAVNSRRSFEDVSTVWVPEIRATLPDAPIVLIGLKTDLRTNTYAALSDPVSTAEGEALASAIGATAYRENSALTADGVPGTFETMLDAALEARTVPGRRSPMVGGMRPIRPEPRTLPPRPRGGN